MSTRCQVIVRTPKKTSLGQNPGDEIYLYRHCDGYPDSIIPSLLMAYKMSDAQEENGWQAARPYKAAGYIIAAGFSPFEAEKPHSYSCIAYEPLPYKELHCDIEYLYIVTPIEKNSEIVWDVEVRTPKKAFYDSPAEENTKRIAKNDIRKLAKNTNLVSSEV